MKPSSSRYGIWPNGLDERGRLVLAVGEVDHDELEGDADLPRDDAHAVRAGRGGAAVDLEDHGGCRWMGDRPMSDVSESDGGCCVEAR